MTKRSYTIVRYPLVDVHSGERYADADGLDSGCGLLIRVGHHGECRGNDETADYSIDHPATGYRAARFETIDRCERFLNLVSHLDWSFTEPNASKEEPFKSQVVQARAAADHGAPAPMLE